MTKIFALANDELSAEVHQNDKTGRFHVILRDIEADMILPTAQIFLTEAAAVAFAKTLID